MVYRPTQVYNGSGWDDIGDKRIGAEAGDIPQASVEDLTSDLASKVDYALPTNAQTGTAYTFVAADAEKLTTASNASPVTLTIPPASSVAWPDNTVLRVVNYGAGAVTVAGGSGVTVTNTATTLAQYQSAAAIRTGSDAWTLVPFAGGGAAELTAADISATTGTVSSATSGGYTTYTWTASGSITLSKAGLASVLVVGGGGGAGGFATSSVGRGGGGAGGVGDITTGYLESGTLSVVVGAGGSGISGNDGYPGAPSLLSPFVGAGGGGGEYRGTDGGFNGASGGGGAGETSGSNGGTGLTTQGNNGGNGFGSGTINSRAGGGGGGAGAAGGNASSATGGAGGNGVDVSATYGTIGGASGVFGGGGGGSSPSSGSGAGGTGGGGAGQSGAAGTSGTANTGGGGGGGGNGTGGNGGSGLVAIRVKA